MKPQYWVPTLAFLAGSIPTLLVIAQFGLASDMRLMIAIAVGAVCAGVASKYLSDRQNKTQGQDKS